ncbi:MAG: hypothetical protein Q7S81_00670 [bacterium]|nr:hypothetical protein [bacterium]
MDINEIINKAVELRILINNWFGSSLVWFQLVSILLSGLFIWGIVYIITKTSYFNGKVENYMDILGFGNLTKRRSLKGWEQIKKRIASPLQQDWKLAVLEADKIMNEILKMAGYLGTDLNKKLEILTKENLSNLDEIKKAHFLSDKIMKDPSMELKKEDAIIALKSFKKAFIELNLLEE